MNYQENDIQENLIPKVAQRRSFNRDVMRIRVRSLTESYSSNKNVDLLEEDYDEIEDDLEEPRSLSRNSSNGEERALKYKILFDQLSQMGFKKDKIDLALKFSGISDLQGALECLIKDEHGWQHSFVPLARADVVRCEICGDTYENHIESIVNPTPNQRIQTTSDDDNRQYLLTEPSIPYSETEESERKETETFSDDIKIRRSTMEQQVSCNICYMEHSIHRCHALSCKHYFCYECIRGYLDFNISNGKVLSLKCPEAACEKKYDVKSLRALCPREIFEKYERFKMNFDVNINPHLRWCPAINCNRFVEGTVKKPKVKCECGHIFCFKCGQDWHTSGDCQRVP